MQGFPYLASRMCISIRHIRLLLSFLLLVTAVACKHISPSAAVTISGQVLDEKTNQPIPGINVRLKAVFSPAMDTQINAAVTNQDGKYKITTNRVIIDRYTDTANISYQKAQLTLTAEPVQAAQPHQYKNPYKTDRKGLPHLFFNQVMLPRQALQESSITQDIKMQAGAMIVCRSKQTNIDTDFTLNITGLQAPRDHFQLTINKQRYLVIRPGHPYLLNILRQPPRMDTITPVQIIRQDTIRLKALDTLPVNL